MNILELAQQDTKTITEDLSGFGSSLTILNTASSQTVDFIGQYNEHYTAYDTDGVKVSSKIASISVAEKTLTDKGYIVRVDGKVSLKKHRVTFTNAVGITETFTVREQYPDEQLGLIVLILGSIEL